MKSTNTEQLSDCCGKPVYTAHGCDDDFRHLGKPCTCTAVVTMWYECSGCKKLCNIATPEQPKAVIKENLTTEPFENSEELDTPDTEELPKGKSKLIDPDTFKEQSQALAPEKIKPLNIEDYTYTDWDIPGAKLLNEGKAIRALFEKQKEIIEVVNSLVEKKV